MRKRRMQTVGCFVGRSLDGSRGARMPRAVGFPGCGARVVSPGPAGVRQKDRGTSILSMSGAYPLLPLSKVMVLDPAFSAS